MAVSGQIWRPKITLTKGLIGNGINSEDTQFWRGFGDEGHILLSEKIVIETFCTNNLKRFPFDYQICELKFGTYRFPIEEVKLIWDENPVEILTGTHLTEFELVNVSTLHEVDVRPSGNFSISVMQIVVKRYCLHYIMCTIAPCIGLVLLSYLSLWIDYNRSALRLGLCTAAVLLLVYLFNAAICLTPRAPVLKLLDVFIIMCITFSTFSLFENYIVTYMDLNCTDDNVCVAKVYRKLLIWVERIVKIALPLFYTFCLLMFIYCVL